MLSVSDEKDEFEMDGFGKDEFGKDEFGKDEFGKDKFGKGGVEREDFPTVEKMYCEERELKLEEIEETETKRRKKSIYIS